MSRSTSARSRPSSSRPELGLARGQVLDARFWAPAFLWLLSVGLAFWAAPHDPAIVAWLAFTTVGGLVAWLRSNHPVGWLLLADGLVWLAAAGSVRYATEYPGGSAAPLMAAWVDLAGWVVALGLVPLALLLFPTGRFRSRLWRIVAALLVTGGSAVAFANLLTPGPLPSHPNILNPFGFEGLGTVTEFVAPAAEVAFFLGVNGGVASVIVRYFKSSGIERQQLRWLAFASALMLLGFAVGELLTRLDVPGEAWFNTLPMLLVPVAIGIALLRYRLWDLDLVVGKTLAYGVVAAVVAAIYVLLIAGFGALVGGSVDSEIWLVGLATAIAATLFQPLRQSAMSTANQLFFKRGQDGGEPVAIRALGDLRVELDGQPVSRSQWRSKKARQLLKMLIAYRGRPVNRERLIDALWPDDREGNLANRLAVAASTVRGVLDPDKTLPSDYYIKGEGDTLRVDLDHLWVDFEEFLALASAGLEGDATALAQAEALYLGDFLEEDLYQDWAHPVREEARAKYVAVLEKRAEAEIGHDVDRGIAAYLRVLEIDPWNEPAHVAIVSALESVGRHGEARRARRRYEARMIEIGVIPDSI